MMTTSEIPDADDLDRRGDAIADAQQLPAAYMHEIATYDDERIEARHRRFERRQSLWDLLYYGIVLGALALYAAGAAFLLMGVQHLVPLTWQWARPAGFDLNPLEWRISVLLLTISIFSGWAATQGWGGRRRRRGRGNGR